MYHLIFFISLTFSITASADFCAKRFSGLWSCDTDIFGTSIEVKILPPGHGLSNGMISIENFDSQLTELTAPLNYKWTPGEEFYSVKAYCDGKDGISIEFKDREIRYRKASGVYYLTFEEGYSGREELHIYDNVKFNDGSNYKLNATCLKK
jgi:hypothetical protein